MRKHRKFGRVRNQRRAFLKALAVNLILKGKIKTTLARAKSLRPFIEKMITHAKKSGASHAAYAILNKFLPKPAAQKLIKDIAPKYKARNGGYTRIVKLESRKGDEAKIAYIEFV